MIFQYINVCPVPREMLKTSAYGLGFQHLPRDLANVNAWKTMFDPYIKRGKFGDENAAWQPSDYDRVCGKHFIKGVYDFKVFF